MQYSITWFLNGKRSSLLASLLLPSVLCLGCGGPAPLTVDMPLHLEDHLDAATVVGSEVPAELLEPVEWRFDEPQPDWKPVERREPGIKPVQATRTEDALRLTLTEANRGSRDNLHGGIYIDLPDWSREDWAYVEIRARTSDRMESIRLGFNYTEEDPFDLGVPFYSATPWYARAFLVTDGTIQTYRLPLNSPGMRLWEGPWTHLAVLFVSQRDEEAATLDILSIRVVPRGYEYRENAVSVHSPRVGGISRRAIVTYPPSRLEWRVRVPEGGRLDLASGLLDGASDVTFRVNVTVDGDEVVVFEEASADASAWHLGSVDLGAYAGRTIGLTLETESEREGAVAFWGAPTVSGDRPPDEPNVIFYVIDGAGADWMSLYGYNRRTTPFLERLARDAVVFEQAYSNATSTPLSAPSYMTSLLFNSIMPYGSFFDR
ncbi:MAG: sulfatase-like hydrolase/transferase, partial [Gemmatimonadetes bacterium]|nr:sulfatase-like hydrolase/transferase [Gemmatimonadota bacterium]